MQVTAKLNGARISAQKVRLVADQVRGMPVEQAEQLLAFSPKKAADSRVAVCPRIGKPAQAQTCELRRVCQSYAHCIGHSKPNWLSGTENVISAGNSGEDL